MTKVQEQTVTELQELMCDSYCKWPVISNDQDELNDRCNGCEMIKLWNFVNNGESRWIPVSERLPKEDESIRVHVTLKYKESVYVYSSRIRWYFGHFKNLNGSMLSKEVDVIAWKPDILPEPYKGEAD